MSGEGEFRSDARGPEPADARLLQPVPSHAAVLLCRDARFWRYVVSVDGAPARGEVDTRYARRYIQRICKVENRHELDRDEIAARRFHQLIVQPYMAWLGGGSDAVRESPVDAEPEARRDEGSAVARRRDLPSAAR